MHAFLAQAREPSNQIPVAQPAGSVLNIGLAVVHGVLKLGVTHARVPRQMLAQLRSVLLQEGRPFMLEARMQRVVAGQIPQVQEIDVEIDVLLPKLQTLRNRADRVVDPQSGIPQQTHASANGSRRDTHGDSPSSRTRMSTVA